MSILITGLLFLSLASITVEDFTKRMIWWGWIPLLAFTVVLLALRNISTQQLFSYTLLNLAFISIQLILVTAWFTIRSGKLVNISKEQLGWGDILFFIPLCLMFSPVNFIVFFLISIVAVLVGYLIVKSTLFPELKTIPLAGGISMVVLCFFVVNFFLSCNQYSDHHILNLITSQLTN